MKLGKTATVLAIITLTTNICFAGNNNGAANLSVSSELTTNDNTSSNNPYLVNLKLPGANIVVAIAGGYPGDENQIIDPPPIHNSEDMPEEVQTALETLFFNQVAMAKGGGNPIVQDPIIDPTPIHNSDNASIELAMVPPQDPLDGIYVPHGKPEAKAEEVAMAAPQDPLDGIYTPNGRASGTEIESAQAIVNDYISEL